MASHPGNEAIDLLDGNWYANQPYELWAWMRENAPVYYDEPNDVWAINRYDDVLSIEKDPKPAIFTGRPATRPLRIPPSTRSTSSEASLRERAPCRR